MANNIQDNAKTEYVSGSPDYLLNTYDQVQNVLGAPKYSNQLPFYVSIVNSDGKAVTMNLPPNIKQANGVKPVRNIMAVRMLINPNSLTVNMAKMINRTQTMTGWVEDHWGEELDTVTCQGSTAGFVIGDNPLRPTSEMVDRDTARADFYSSIGAEDYTYMYTGLTTTYRRNTVSYEQFKNLIDIFQSNGCVYDDQGFIRQRNYIQLSYDYSKYQGYFESIDVTEDAVNPFRFIYTFTFRAEKTIYSFNQVLWQNKK